MALLVDWSPGKYFLDPRRHLNWRPVESFSSFMNWIDWMDNYVCVVGLDRIEWWELSTKIGLDVKLSFDWILMDIISWILNDGPFPGVDFAPVLIGGRNYRASKRKWSASWKHTCVHNNNNNNIVFFSQASWGRLEMKPKWNKGHGSGTLIASFQALISKAISLEIFQSLRSLLFFLRVLKVSLIQPKFLIS